MPSGANLLRLWIWGLVTPEACDTILKVGYGSHMRAFEHADLAGLDLISDDGAKAVWAELSTVTDLDRTDARRRRSGHEIGQGVLRLDHTRPSRFQAAAERGNLLASRSRAAPRSNPDSVAHASIRPVSCRDTWTIRLLSIPTGSGLARKIGGKWMARLELGMVGAGQGALICGVHRMATRLDGCFDLVAGAFASDPVRSHA